MYQLLATAPITPSCPEVPGVDAMSLLHLEKISSAACRLLVVPSTRIGCQMEQLHLLQAGEAIWINSGFRRHCWGYRANRETYIGMGILTLIQTRSFGMTGKGSTDKSSTDKRPRQEVEPYYKSRAASMSSGKCLKKSSRRAAQVKVVTPFSSFSSLERKLTVGSLV